ncbi:MAG: serine/threonine protein kinase [Candidatus Riflebacteria bacterium]|nr:serine/threonine protein kinase [Candidatus Riflebacteria bacterium]
MTLQRLGPYRIIAPIGQGGMGQVFRAEHEVLHREVALKVLHPRALGDEKAAHRFRREMKLACGLRHQNLVRFYDGGTIDEIAYLAMELVAGEGLDRLLIRKGALSWRQAASLALSIADALAYLHDNGIIHRDIKPSNVMLGDDGVVRVLDFGLSLKADSTRVTEDGSLVGTLLYSAPELLLGAQTSAASDLWALGCVLFALLFGGPPFFASTAHDYVSRILDESVALPAAPQLPPGLCQLVLQLLEKDPSRRVGTAAQVRDRLSDLFCEPGEGPPMSNDAARGPGPEGRTTVRTHQHPTKPLPPTRGSDDWADRAAEPPTERLPTPARGVSTPPSTPLRLRRLRVALPLALVVAAALVVAWRSTPPPGAAGGRASPAGGHRLPMTQVLGLRLRPVEDSIAVHAFTTAPARLHVDCQLSSQGSATATAATEATTGRVHRVVVTGLQPDRVYTIVVRGVEPGPAVWLAPMTARTLSVDDRQSVLAYLSARAAMGHDTAEETLHNFQRVASDADVPQLREMLTRCRVHTTFTAGFYLVGTLGSPALSDWTLGALDPVWTGTYSFSPVAMVEAMRALESLGSPGAVEALVRFCQVSSSQGVTRGVVTMDACRFRAARALGLVDPGRAGSLFVAMASSEELRPVALAGAAWMRHPLFGATVLDLLGKAPEEVPARTLRAVVAAGLRMGGPGVTALARVALRHPGLTALDRLLALSALGTWGGDDDVRDLIRLIDEPIPPAVRWSEYISGAMADPPDEVLVAMAATSIGMIAGRTRDRATRELVLGGLSRALKRRSGAVQTAALRALASVGDPASRRVVEALVGSAAPDGVDGAPPTTGLYTGPAADLCLALSRCGSAKAVDAVAALCLSSRPVDLWMAAVASTAMPARARAAPR